MYLFYKKDQLLVAPVMSSRVQGFTLIEILIVVVIIGLLSAIAIPSYTQYVQKGRRVDAKTALLDLAAREEKFFATNNIYSKVGTDLAYPSDFPVVVTSGSKSYYTMTLTQTKVGDFTVTATPTGAQITDACYAYVLTYLGEQSNTVSGGGVNSKTDCW